MKRTLTVFGLVLALGAIFTATPGWADSETTGSSPLDAAIDKTASGTKYVGPLTIVYSPTGTTCPVAGGGPQAHMTFVIRLAKGNSLSGAAGQTSSPICMFDNDTQIQIISDFFTGTLFPTAQAVALKGVTNIFNGTLFTVMDVELAVRE
jgi:hypothetical protein